MPVVIVASLIPLGFKVETLPLRVLDKVAMVIFIIDYLLRWATADFKAGEKSVKVFIQYPFTTMAIVDLISILPSLTLVNESLKTLRALRMLRALRSIRVLKGMRYWKNFVILGNVLETCPEDAAGAPFHTRAEGDAVLEKLRHPGQCS